MTTRTLGVLVCAVCGLIVLVGLVSPKPALSEAADGYGQSMGAGPGVVAAPQN